MNLKDDNLQLPRRACAYRNDLQFFLPICRTLLDGDKETKTIILLHVLKSFMSWTPPLQKRSVSNQLEPDCVLDQLRGLLLRQPVTDTIQHFSKTN